MSCNVTLREVVEFQKGFAFKSKDYKDNGVRIVKVSNLTSDSIDISQCVCIDEELAIKYSDKYNLIYDDIIITTVGSWPTNPASVVGKVVKVPKNASHTLLNQNAVRLRSNDNLHQRYLYYMLKNNDFREYIVGTAQGSANQASITQEDIKNYEFNLPSLEEQEKIANILSSLDDKIELNNEMNKTLEEMAQALFKRWFVDFEFPDEDGEPYKSSGGEMVESERGMIPKGWEVKEFGDIVDFKYGKMPKKSDIADTGFPIFSGYKITGYYKECMFEESQLIVVARGVGGTGDVKFSPPKCFLTNLSIAILLRDNNIIKEYLYYYLKNSNLKLLDTGSAQSQITITNLSKFKIINPTNDIMKKFHIFVSRLLKMKDSLEIENKSLIETRDTLLPKLMSGEIRVK